MTVNKIYRIWGKGRKKYWNIKETNKTMAESKIKWKIKNNSNNVKTIKNETLMYVNVK